MLVTPAPRKRTRNKDSPGSATVEVRRAPDFTIRLFQVGAFAAPASFPNVRRGGDGLRVHGTRRRAASPRRCLVAGGQLAADRRARGARRPTAACSPTAPTATGKQTGYFIYDMWDPSAASAGGHLTLATCTRHGHLLQLAGHPAESGKIFIAGGDNWTGTGTTNTGNNNSNVFDAPTTRSRAAAT